MSDALPPCGLYRTTVAIGEVAAHRLVYFHNHGDPGPGLYLPEGWDANRARFPPRGFTLPAPVEAHAATLAPLAPEGFYRVVRPFFCCEKRCREFEPDLLVQLGYNGAAEPILFVPEREKLGVAIPTQGSALDAKALANLAPLKLAHRHTPAEAASAPGGVLH